MDLFLVESYGKVQKLQNILGNQYKVMATGGHCIDLPQKKLGVDIENGFKATYTVIPGKEDNLSKIVDAAKSAKSIILASDPDREGEFIAYSIANQLPKDKKIQRVTFNAITKQAVMDGLAKAGNINTQLVNAQMARRILDRVCGFKTSPHVMKFISGAKSAGRVQSAVLRIICEREDEIDAFVPQEYWEFQGIFETSGAPLTTELKKPKFGVRDDTELSPEKIPAFEKFCRAQPFIVSELISGEVKDNPHPPFTTSSLQQAAASNFGWGAKKTMGVAQQLYNNARISYHRTDAVTLSPEFIADVRQFIGNLGSDYLPATPVTYKNKVACAQEAHEACRVTHLEDQNFSNDDEGKLYELIWRRSVSCQMTPAIFTKTKVVLSDAKKVAVFESHTKVQKFDGHLKIWTYSKPSTASPPAVVLNQACKLLDLKKEQKFTNPPGRYTDGGSLTKRLEELGIGRPATLASMTSTLLERNYVVKEGNSLKPTPLGRKIVEHLKKNGFSFIDLSFTAKMEENLDEVANGTKTKLQTLQEFWAKLSTELQKSQAQIPHATIHKDPCPQCGGQLTAKTGVYGPYVTCTAATPCGFKSKLTLEGSIKPKASIQEQGACPKCGKKTILREHPKFGKYITCEDWKPKKAKEKGACDYTAQIDKEGKTTEKKAPEIIPNLKCPKCSREIVKRTGRFGDFFSCNGYPKCKTIVDENGQIKIRKAKGGKKKNLNKGDGAIEGGE